MLRSDSTSASISYFWGRRIKPHHPVTLWEYHLLVPVLQKTENKATNVNRSALVRGEVQWGGVVNTHYWPQHAQIISCCRAIGWQTNKNCWQTRPTEKSKKRKSHFKRKQRKKLNAETWTTSSESPTTWRKTKYRQRSAEERSPGSAAVETPSHHNEFWTEAVDQDRFRSSHGISVTTATSKHRLEKPEEVGQKVNTSPICRCRWQSHCVRVFQCDNFDENWKEKCLGCFK